MFDVKGKFTTATITIDEIEDTCLDQIKDFVDHPAFDKKIAIMPDTHAGKGSVIGFTMPVTEKIIPNVIGVDIGCGMLSARIKTGLPEDLAKFDADIRSAIPFGHNLHSRGIIHMQKEFPWDELSKKNIACSFDQDWFVDLCRRMGLNQSKIINSAGTLGGGNHFIEFGQSTNGGDIWITIHSGSRNLGKTICDHWQKRAIKRLHDDAKLSIKDKVAELKQQLSGVELGNAIKELAAQSTAHIKDDLCYLEGEETSLYLLDMMFAQMFASVNRKLMLKKILNILGTEAVETIESVHNYIDFDDNMIRKGAIRSYTGEKMIIPFNMRDGLLICEGKSNPEWNFSAPHGAGRLFSRSEARKRLSVDEFSNTMSGIFSTSVGQSTIDEAPGAYKEARFIENAIGPTATIVDRIKPIMNLKDNGGGSR